MKLCILGFIMKCSPWFFFFVIVFWSCVQQKTEESSHIESIDETVDTIAKMPVEKKNFPRQELLGQIDERTDHQFVEIVEPYASRRGMYLRKECYQAFREMADQARKDGVELVVISAMRNFKAQKSIWERKWTGQTKVDGLDLSTELADPKLRALRILRFSSMPGSSRHHWGTDLDINQLTNNYFSTGRGKAEYEWLLEHAASYGFAQPYTAKGDQRPNGYEEEKWHWSYLPISKELTDAAKTQLENADYSGFLGDQVAADIDILNNYVLGIDPSCL